MKRWKNVGIFGSRPSLCLPGSFLLQPFKQPLWVTVPSNQIGKQNKWMSSLPTLSVLHSNISHSVCSNKIHYLSLQSFSSCTTRTRKWHCYPHSPLSHSIWGSGQLPLSFSIFNRTKDACCLSIFSSQFLPTWLKFRTHISGHHLFTCLPVSTSPFPHWCLLSGHHHKLQVPVGHSPAWNPQLASWHP